MKKLSALFLIMLFFGAVRAQDSGKEVWVADNGDGTYKNPILHQDYSDPDVVRVGDDFYMTASSFNVMPGLPVLHSKDMVNWELINHAVKRFPDNEFDYPQHGGGIWAPCFRHHDGTFYIYWGDPDRGIFMVKTDDPAGEWSAPALVKDAKGNIDPSPLWDDDGKVYMVHAFARSRAGIKHVLQVNELSPEGDEVIDDGTIVFNGDGVHPTIEGPKFIKRNGYYYIFAPGGGVTEGWQVVMRSKNVLGPYEDKIVLAQGDTEINGPHQGAYIELDNGQGWFYHFQDKEPYGRIVHLQPVKWENDWPVMGVDEDGDGTGEPVLEHEMPDVGEDYPAKGLKTTDHFDDGYGLQWQWHANFYDHWYSSEQRDGHLRLYSQFVSEYLLNLWEAPNLLLQKFPAPEFTATAKVDFSGLNENERAGLLVMGYDYFSLEVEKRGDNFRVSNVACEQARKNNPEETKATETVDTPEMFLRVKVGKDKMGQFYYSTDGDNFKALGPKFRASEGHWIGGKVGLFAISNDKLGGKGYMDADAFVVE